MTAFHLVNFTMMDLVSPSNVIEINVVEESCYILVRIFL